MGIQLTAPNLDFNVDNGLLKDNSVVNTDPTKGYKISVVSDSTAGPNSFVGLRDANNMKGSFNAALDINMVPSKYGKLESRVSVTSVFNETVKNDWGAIDWNHDVARFNTLYDVNWSALFVDLNDDGNYTSGTDFDLGFWGYQSDFDLNSVALGVWRNVGGSKKLTTLSAANRAMINGHKVGFSIIARKSISAEDGSNFSIDNITLTAQPVCFARGAKITTDRGEMAIEDLRPGDLVLTMDRGFQSIRWIGSTRFSVAALHANPKLAPVTIRAGAMGRGLPHTDLRVSPQHRMLLISHSVEYVMGFDEVLVPAVKLVGAKGITQAIEGEIEYFHMLFDCHEIVYANGAPAESLYLGESALVSLSEEARLEIFTIFPELVERVRMMASARSFLSKKPAIQNILKRI